MEIVRSIMANVAALRPSREIDAKDQMYGQHDPHYFGVGRSSALMIASALTARLAYAGGDAPIGTALDFGCGHGRVARFLRALLPEARIEVTDFNRPGVNFCVERLGCFDMGETVPSARYDLIWVGSVFTHLPEKTNLEVLAQLKAALRPGGVLVLTTGGRLGALTLENFLLGRSGPRASSYGLSSEGAAKVVADFRALGFGYHDYPGQTGYGGALISPAWMFDHAVDDQTLMIMFQEMGWDTHQDAYAFLRVAAGDYSEVDRGPYFY